MKREILTLLLIGIFLACKQTDKNVMTERALPTIEETKSEVITTYKTEKPIVTKITDNIYSVYSTYYSSLVVIGDDGVLITDPSGSYRAEILKTEINKLTKLPVKYIMISHEHYDHVDGYEVFKDAELIAQKKSIPIFELDVMGMAPKKVDITFEDKFSVTMGKTKVEIIHYGFPSDGVSNSIVWLPNEKVAYTADLYEDHELQDKAFIESLNSLGVRKILNKVVEMKPRYAIASHSVKMTPEALHLGANFFNDLYNEVYPKLMDAKTKGYEEELKFKATFPKELKMEKYKDFKNYNHLYRHVERMMESILHGG